jgi:general secretion pathway protein G
MRIPTKNTNRAFTLVEVLLVIVIIGILAGMLVARLSGRTEEARVARARADIQGSLSLALDLFEQDLGRYPTAEEGLASLVTNPGIEGWKGPYLKGGLKNDPWGMPYTYALNSDDPTQYALSSSGPDKQPGTADDILP